MNENTITDCRTEESITVGLIDAIISISRVLRYRNLKDSNAVKEALKDLRQDKDLYYVMIGTFKNGD